MFIPLHDANALKHIRLQYVTLGVIAVNVLFWLATGTPIVSDAEVKQASFLAYGFIPSVANGFEVLPVELDRIPPLATYVTYAFFHGDFMHLAGNMLFIWVFGDNVEDATGHFRFVIFYLVCAAAAALTHSLVDPQSPVPLIGASGAASGIMGAYLLLHPKIRVWALALGRIPLRIPAAVVLLGWIGFQIFQFFSDLGGQVSWAAHIGGFLAGMVLILFMRRSGVLLFDRVDNVVLADPADIGSAGETGNSGQTTEKAADKAVRTGSVPATGKRGTIRWGRGGGDEN